MAKFEHIFWPVHSDLRRTFPIISGLELWVNLAERVDLAGYLGISSKRILTKELARNLIRRNTNGSIVQDRTMARLQAE